MTTWTLRFGSPISGIGRLWRRHLRRIDLKILWPACKEKAPNMEIAKGAFAVHAFNDSAWTRDFSEAELTKFIEELR